MTDTAIKTKKTGVSLRQIELKDVPAYFALLESGRKHFSKFGGMSETRYRSRKEIAESIVDPHNPKKLRFGVWDGKTFIGVVSLIQKGNKRCEIGGWIGNRFTRKGYGSRAINALSEYAKETCGCTRVIATTRPENIPSQQMLKKCGFVPVRKMKNRHYFVYF